MIPTVLHGAETLSIGAAERRLNVMEMKCLGMCLESHIWIK